MWRAIHIQGATPFPFLGPDPILEMRSGSDGVESDCNRDGEHKPSPRCSPSQTGPGGPGSWAAPGTGTGSAREERQRMNIKKYTDTGYNMEESRLARQIK